MKKILVLILMLIQYDNIEAQNLVLQTRYGNETYSLPKFAGKPIKKLKFITSDLHNNYIDFINIIDGYKENVNIEHNIICNNKELTIHKWTLDYKSNKKIILKYNLKNNEIYFSQPKINRMPNKYDSALEYFQSLPFKDDGLHQSHYIKFILKSCNKDDLNTWDKERDRTLDFMKKSKDFIGESTNETERKRKIEFYISQYKFIGEDYSFQLLTENFNKVDSLYQVLLTSSPNKVEFNEFISNYTISNYTNRNKINELISLSSIYLSNSYSKKTFDEFNSYQNSKLEKGSNINLFKNTKIVELSDNQILFESRLKYYITDSTLTVKDSYNLLVKIPKDKIDKVFAKYSKEVINKYYNEIKKGLKNDSYKEREIIGSTYDKSFFQRCLFESVRVLGFGEYSSYCTERATKYRYKVIDKSFLIPEKEWYYISFKNDDVFVRNFGLLKEVLVYDGSTKTFKIKSTSNSSLTLEKDFQNRLNLRSFNDIKNEYILNNYNNYVIYESIYGGIVYALKK